MSPVLVFKTCVKHTELSDHLGAEAAEVLKGVEGEGPKSWGAALTLARRPLTARTTKANCIVPRIFQDFGQPAKYVVDTKC